MTNSEDKWGSRAECTEQSTCGEKAFLVTAFIQRLLTVHINRFGPLLISDFLNC